MKLLLIAILGFLGFANESDPIVKQVNVEKSMVTWTGYKVLGSHAGTLQVKKGELHFEGDNLIGGEFMIDMTSMVCTDLEGEPATNLVGHLSSDDFFGVAMYPTAKLVITKVASRGTAGSYKINGDLTIKDKTQSISFNAMVKEGVGEAKIEVDRSEFDIKYGSGSFFDNLGDNTIYDEFELNVTLAF